MIDLDNPNSADTTKNKIKDKPAKQNNNRDSMPEPSEDGDPFYDELKRAPTTNPRNRIVFKYNTIMNKYETNFKVDNDFPIACSKVTTTLRNLKGVKFYNYEDVDAHMNTIWCEMLFLCII